MKNISVTLDEELIEWLDQLVERGVIKSRSEAIRGGIYAFIREKLGVTSRQQLREYLRQKQKKPFQRGVEAIRSVRAEGE